MGVKNLWPILSPIHERKSLWELHDKILAIDLSCWVCDSQHIELHNQPRMYLRNLFFRTSCLLLLGVKPIFVLEGKAPELKHFVMSQRVQHRNRNKKQNSSSEEESIKGLEVGKKGRNKGSRSHFNSILKQCQELLRIMGVACVQSLGEAEALCAQLDEAELVDGCISQDGDCFLYGARTVYRNFTISSHGTSGYSVDEYKMTAVEEKLALSRRKLIALSLLCGCDYNDKGVLGIGKETAMKFLESLKDDEVLNRLKKWRVDPIYMSLENEYQSLDNICSKCTHPGKLQKHAKRGCDLCDTQSDCTETTDEHLIRKDPEEKKIIIAELTMRRKALKDETFPSQDMIDEFLHKQPLPDLDITWKQPDISSFLVKEPGNPKQKESHQRNVCADVRRMEKIIPSQHNKDIFVHS
ncbi:flap endonuclease GEN isoform X2 [Periplaneta americana]|uniref:flap endonuclease GEN isoform X2 n=1 Tax=Periplaneta americana TaxID=6978 RepID=UPI0037E71B8E